MRNIALVLLFIVLIISGRCSGAEETQTPDANSGSPRTNPDTTENAENSDRNGNAYLGVLFIEHINGVRVVSVHPDSPAAKAGIKRGFVITALNDEPVAGRYTLKNKLARFYPGDVVHITVMTDSYTKKIIDVELEEKPDQVDAPHS